MSDTVTDPAVGRPILSAMWVWALTPAEATAVADFVRKRQVHTVFLSVGRDGPEPHVVTLARTLRARDVAVQCLGGDSSWLDFPDRARHWLAQAVKAGGFDAVHLDVEPWTLPEWELPNERVRLLEQYENVLRAVGGTGLPLEVAVAPRLASDWAGTRCAIDAVLGLADRLSVMAYRDHAEGANGILDVSWPARRACSELGIEYRIGVETQPAEKAGGPGNTFAEEGRAALEREAAIVADHLGQDPFFLGVAVHDWRHWRGLA